MKYNELNQRYKNEVFSNGKCPYFDKCKSNSSVCESFNYARIGKSYLSNKTKIMFVGKESIRSKNTIVEPIKIYDAEADNKHYLGLYYTAIMLLKGKEPNGFSKNDLTEHTGLESQYCLTNYFKCAFKESEGQKHGVKVNKNMKKYCPKLLAKEINFLKPDIIIIQGKFTNEFFWDEVYGELFNVVYEPKELFIDKKGKIELYKYLYKDCSKPLYIVWGYHPAGSQFYSTLDSFKKALSLIPIK